ncbi:MAG: hypothetical protein SNH28_03670 [Rikenellaceae bacterium]
MFHPLHINAHLHLQPIFTSMPISTFNPLHINIHPHSQPLFTSTSILTLNPSALAFIL